jgi:hypothetical protein
MPYDGDAHNDDITAGSGEFIPSLTCRVRQKMPIIPSKSKVLMPLKPDQRSVLGAV